MTMTAKRNYQCNLCHSGITDGTGRGVHHQTGPHLKFTTLLNAENHLCDSCVKALQEAFRGERIAADPGRAPDPFVDAAECAALGLP